MKIEALPLPGALLLTPRVFADERGAFLETWNARAFAEAGIDATFVQDNMSISRRGTLRGLHYQLHNAQGKLVRVLRGEIFDVIVDLRRSCASFGQAYSLRLNAEEQQTLWVPAGFAHGFLALGDDTRVTYKVTDYWSPQWERTLAWNDPALGIAWPLAVGGAPLLSDKDRLGQPLATADAYP